MLKEILLQLLCIFTIEINIISNITISITTIVHTNFRDHKEKMHTLSLDLDACVTSRLWIMVVKKC